MKIAMVATGSLPIPPQKYGGTEWVIYHLSRGLAEKGNKVDLITSGDSKHEPSYNLISMTDKSYWLDPDLHRNEKLIQIKTFIYIADTIKYLLSNQYDIIHVHDRYFLIFSEIFKHRGAVIMTHHTRLNTLSWQIALKHVVNASNISISNNQRKDAPDISFFETIYHGVDLNDFTYSETLYKEPDAGYLFFMARFTPEKGPIDAAKAAIKTGKKILFGGVVDNENIAFFEDFKPLIDNSIVHWIGEISSIEERSSYLSKARALIIPIQWEEPFGLMFIEAMACGTPVVAFAHGSVPEVIKDGETGFIVNSSDDDIRGDWIIKKTGIEGLCEAIERIYNMPADQYLQMRRNCRKHVEDNFTVERMVDEYEKVYQKIIANQK
jgi:glycosyltransferase involved in cell wall biosynthesis